MTVEQIIILVLAVPLAFAVVAVIVLLAALRKKQTGGRAEDVKIIDGVRYSRSDAVSENGEVRATHRVGDFVLARGEEKTAEKNGELLPGTYTVLATSDGTAAFKLRLGGLVREYKHGDTVVLGDGESICAVSCSVILR